MPYFIAAAVAAVVLVWGIVTFNGFVRYRNRIDESFSTMDVYLRKRYDLIPNLVETVKGYAAHEQQTLERVVAARNTAASATEPARRIEGEASLTGALRQLFALAESYPALRADSQFTILQNQLQRAEEDIALSRKYYNAVVRGYNTMRQTFPALLIARLGGFGERAYFQADDEEERSAVKVSF